MKKILVLLTFILLLVSCMYDDNSPKEENYVARDASDFWQNVKLGDTFTVSRTTVGEDTTFDFTGLNIDDSYIDTISLYISYYKYIASVGAKTEVFIIDTDAGYTDYRWTMTQYEDAVMGDRAYRDLTSNIFTQTWTDTTTINYATETDSTEVELYYNPREGAEFKYYIEGDITNGTGTIKVVGYQHEVDGQTEVFFPY